MFCKHDKDLYQMLKCWSWLIVVTIHMKYLDWLVDVTDEDNRSEAHNHGGATLWDVTTNVVSVKHNRGKNNYNLYLT